MLSLSLSFWYSQMSLTGIKKTLCTAKAFLITQRDCTFHVKSLFLSSFYIWLVKRSHFIFQNSFCRTSLLTVSERGLSKSTLDL